MFVRKSSQDRQFTHQADIPKGALLPPEESQTELDALVELAMGERWAGTRNAAIDLES
jgi:hypothetical protein